MMNMIGKKVRGIIGATEKVGVIYDITADGSKVWVETSEDLYVVDINAVEVLSEEVEAEAVAEAVVEEVNEVRFEKASASVEFGKYEHENIFGEIEYRMLTVDITLTAKTEEGVEALWSKFAERLEEVSNIDIQWSTCPTVDKNSKGSWYYSESFCVDYEHGMMTEIKKDFMADFKAVKKEFGIR